MLRRAIICTVFLMLHSTSFAGVAITLVPTNPGPYEPGQQVNIDILAQLTAGTPSVPGPGGTMTSIRVRMMQFDFSDSDPALLASIAPALHHPYSEIMDPPIPFWDYTGASACASDEYDCGTNYFVDGWFNDATPNIVNTTYAGLTSSGFFMITLNQTSPKRLGEFIVTMPSVPGIYVLDVLNADEADENKGADIRWGFGTLGDPTDPTSPLRANSGGITGGQLRIVPEPGTLALLGVGSLVLGVRRRHNLQAA